jgi:CspA family cold shock protein
VSAWDRITADHAVDGWKYDDSVQQPRLTKDYPTGVSAVIVVVDEDGTLCTACFVDDSQEAHRVMDWAPSVPVAAVRVAADNNAHRAAVDLGLSIPAAAGWARREHELPPGGGPIHTGSVKWFDSTKGFGFVTRDDGGPELFLYYKSLPRGTHNADQQRDIAAGTRICFEIGEHDKGPKAVNVQFLDEPPEGGGYWHRLAERHATDGWKLRGTVHKYLEKEFPELEVRAVITVYSSDGTLAVSVSRLDDKAQSRGGWQYKPREATVDEVKFIACQKAQENAAVLKRPWLQRFKQEY